MHFNQEGFDEAMDRNIVYLPANGRGIPDGPDVTGEYLRAGGFMPANCVRIMLTHDREGVVFKALEE